MHNKYCTIHNTDTVVYATHSGSYSTECKKEVHYTPVHMWYTAVHNIHSGAQHIQDTVLPEGQVVIILSSTLTSQC